MTGFGNNTVTLTAGENAILDLSSIEDISEDILDFSFVKNNLVIKTGDNGQITIANFKKKDTTGENGSVLLKISDDEEGIIDLKTKLFHAETTKDYKGAWYSEDIDATGALTGLKIAGGKGNDVITVNKGGNTFIFNHGDGEDTLVNAGSEDVIQFENAVLTDGINLKGNMESVAIGDNVNIANWCDQIKGNVVSWLTENGYDSVYEVFYGDDPYEGDDIDTLVGYYDTQYSAG